MTREDYLADYESALKAQSEVAINAFKQEKQAELNVKLAEIRLKLFSGPTEPSPKKRKTILETFIEKHSEVLTSDDLEFLKEPAKTPAQIATYVGISEGEARKRIREGIYNPGRNDRPGGKRFACSMHVVEYLLTDGFTKEK